MKNIKKILFLSTIAVALLGSGCSNDGPKFYTLTLVVTQDLGLNENAILNEPWQYLLNYKFPDSCDNAVVIPEVTIVRADLASNKDNEAQIPLLLSGFNAWRPKSLINEMMIQEDYDALLPNMKYPPILTVKSGKTVDAASLLANYPGAIVTSLDKSGEALRKMMLSQICAGEKKSITLILTGGAATVPPMITAADTTEIESPTPIAGDALAAAFSTLIDLKKSPDERSEMISGIVEQFFTSDGTIEEMGEGNLRLPVKPVENYLNSLITSRTIVRLEILDRKMKDGRCWTVKIKEHHQ